MVLEIFKVRRAGTSSVVTPKRRRWLLLFPRWAAMIAWSSLVIRPPCCYNSPLSLPVVAVFRLMICWSRVLDCWFSENWFMFCDGFVFGKIHSDASTSHDGGRFFTFSYPVKFTINSSQILKKSTQFSIDFAFLAINGLHNILSSDDSVSHSSSPKTVWYCEGLSVVQ